MTNSNTSHASLFFVDCVIHSVLTNVWASARFVVVAEIRTEAVMQALAMHNNKRPVMLPSKRTSVNYQGQQRRERQGQFGPLPFKGLGLMSVCLSVCLRVCLSVRPCVLSVLPASLQGP